MTESEPLIGRWRTEGVIPIDPPWRIAAEATIL